MSSPQGGLIPGDMAEHVVNEVNLAISFPSVKKVITLETEPLENWIGKFWVTIMYPSG